MCTVEAGCNEKDRTVDILTPGEFNAVRILVRLAEQESHAEKNGQEQVSSKPINVIT